MIKTMLLLISVVLFGSCTSQSVNSDSAKYTTSTYNAIEFSTYTYKENLDLDFYSAVDGKDSNRPLIVVMHGGGFQGGSRQGAAELKFCIDMARRGFAVSSISYRLIRQGKGFDCNTSHEEKMETFKEATVDLLQAVNFLMDKSKELAFNENQIILVGSSAGAETIMNTIYMRGADVFQDIDYGDAKFAGAISLAGAIVDMSKFDENAVPTIFFHGEKDNLVPYATASHHFCTEDAPGYMVLHGSKTMADKLNEIGESFLLMHDPNGNHGWSGWGYEYTQEVADFIEQTVIQGEKLQQITSVSR